MSFLCKIGIHKYEIRQTAFVDRVSYRYNRSGNRMDFTYEGKLFLKKCSECGKEKAIVEMEDFSTKTIPVWKAKKIKGEK